MDPTGPSQPSLNTVYDHPSNPAQSAPEHASSKSTAASQQRSDPTQETRHPSSGKPHSQAMPSSLGYGAQDDSGDAGEARGDAVSNTEGEQMRAAGDGDIARAQDGKHGFGEQGDLASDMDRKKDQQAEIKEARRGGDGGDRSDVDVGSVLGGKGSGFVGAGEQAGGEGQQGSGGGMQSSHQNV